MNQSHKPGCECISTEPDTGECRACGTGVGACDCTFRSCPACCGPIAAGEPDCDCMAEPEPTPAPLPCGDGSGAYCACGEPLRYRVDASGRQWTCAGSGRVLFSVPAPSIVRTEYPDGSSEVHAAGCGSGSCYGGCVPAPILASLVSAPERKLNGGGL